MVSPDKKRYKRVGQPKPLWSTKHKNTFHSRLGATGSGSAYKPSISILNFSYIAFLWGRYEKACAWNRTQATTHRRILKVGVMHPFSMVPASSVTCIRFTFSNLDKPQGVK